jgi:hypothetical protein
MHCKLKAIKAPRRTIDVPVEWDVTVIKLPCVRAPLRFVPAKDVFLKVELVLPGIP